MATIPRNSVRCRSALVAIMTGAAFIVGATAARAEVKVVRGEAGKLVLIAHDASIREVLEALSHEGNFHFGGSTRLSRVVTGTYSGSLQQVLAHVLDGYDTVIRSSPSGVTLTVIGLASPIPAIASGYPGAPPRVSSNLDLDEELAAKRAREAAAAPRAPAPASPAATAVAAQPAAVPSHPAISSNIDLDEERSMPQSPPRTVAATNVLPASVQPVGLAGPAPVPFHPAVSSNVDLDEENSVRVSH